MIALNQTSQDVLYERGSLRALAPQLQQIMGAGIAGVGIERYEKKYPSKKGFQGQWNLQGQCGLSGQGAMNL